MTRTTLARAAGAEQSWNAESTRFQRGASDVLPGWIHHCHCGGFDGDRWGKFYGSRPCPAHGTNGRGIPPNALFVRGAAALDFISFLFLLVANSLAAPLPSLPRPIAQPRLGPLGSSS